MKDHGPRPGKTTAYQGNVSAALGRVNGVTEQLTDAGRARRPWLLGIAVLDHVVTRTRRVGP